MEEAETKKVGNEMAKKSPNYDVVVKILSNYNLIKGHVEFLENMLEEVDINDGITSVKYDQEFTSKTNKIVRLVEDTAIRNIEYADVLCRQIKLYTHKITTIEVCLGHLKPVQREIIQLRYFDECDWNTICDELLYSRAACYKHHEQAIGQLDTLLYGLGQWFDVGQVPKLKRVDIE
jgi:hypothetical protein